MNSVRLLRAYKPAVVAQNLDWTVVIASESKINTIIKMVYYGLIKTT